MNHARIRAILLPAVVACLLVSGSARADLSPSPSGVAEPARAAIFVDPLGFLLFGPTVSAEVGFDRYSVVAYGRWLSAGLLARALFESSTDKFTFSPGAGLKGRYYLTERLVGTHVGVAVEVLKTRTENHTDRVATTNWVLVPQAEIGYRSTYGKLFVGGTLGLGYAAQVSSSVENLEGGSSAARFEAKSYSTVYGSANLDVGFLF